MNISLDSICATCLSQGRKMYLVKSYPPPYYMMGKDFQLKATDKLCWECHHFVLKMGAFRQRGLRAQARLAAFLREPTPLESLSRLRTSTTQHFSIKEPPQEQVKTEILTETVKLEVDFMNCTDDAIEYDASEANEAFEYKEESDAIDEYMDEVTNCQVFSHIPQAKTVRDVLQQKYNVYGNTSVGCENLFNVSLASLLNKKGPEPPLPVEIPKGPSIEIDGTSSFKIRISTQNKSTEENIKQSTDNPLLEHNEENNEIVLPVTPQVPFTEERLTEEELTSWWERKRHKDFYVKSILVYRCEMCVEPFFFRPSFRSHQKMHTDTYGELSCNVCQIRCSKEETLKAHKEKHYRLLTCAYCGFKWDNYNSMRQHCSEEHKVPIEVYTCEICLHEEPSRIRLLRHLNIHCSIECTECGVKTKPSSFKAHMLLHNRGPEKPYVCECGSKFHSKPLLKSHMKRHNKELNEKAYCVECNIQFQNMQSYHGHMTFSAKHVSMERLSKHQCKECGRGFSSATGLRDHWESIHSEQRNYSCDTCSESFKTRRRLRDHRRMKHEGRLKAKDKICDYCGKAFRSKPVLVDHINSHTGVRPYKCDLCGDTFGHKSARYLHMRYKHKVPKKTVEKE